MIDKAMKRYGYTKTDENEFGVYYIKHEEQNWNHVVCVIHKENGRHIMQSYDKKCILDDYGIYVNECAGVEIPVLLLMWMKAKAMSLKYRWWKEKRR